MKTRKIFLNVSWLFASILFLFVSCSDNEQSTGRITVKMTDAPFPSDMIAETNVSIDKVEIRRAGDEDEGESSFIVLSEEAVSYNLLTLTNGVTATLADLEVPVGDYDLVRLYVSDANVELDNGDTYDLFVPSGAQSGLKLFVDPVIQVRGGLTTDLILDFNVAESFVAQGDLSSMEGINGFIFKPVIRAENNSFAGRLSGVVNDSDTVGIDGATVSVYAADTLTTTALTDSVGGYTVLALPAGTYDVMFEKDDFSAVEIEDVNITAANITTLDAYLEEE